MAAASGAAGTDAAGGLGAGVGTDAAGGLDAGVGTDPTAAASGATTTAGGFSAHNGSISGAPI